MTSTYGQKDIVNNPNWNKHSTAHINNYTKCRQKIPFLTKTSCIFQWCTDSWSIFFPVETMGRVETFKSWPSEKGVNSKWDEKEREIDKIGYTRVVSEQNRVPFFSRRSALTHVCKTPPKRVLAPEPPTPCVRAAPQTVFSVFESSKQRQRRRPKSALHEQPDFVQEHPGYTLPCASIL